MVGLAMAVGVGVAINQKEVQKVAASANDYNQFSENLVAANYLLVGVDERTSAMTAATSSNRLKGTSVSPTAGTISSPAASIVWSVAKSGDYWTFYNASTSKYAAGNGTANKLVLSNTTDDYILWSYTCTDGIYYFVNKGNSTQQSPVNANLRFNKGNADNAGPFACYGPSTGVGITLFKQDDGQPSVTITNGSKIAAHNTAMALSATIANNNSYTLHWTSDTAGVTFSSSTSSSGGSITATVANTVPVGTKITITATAKDGETTKASSTTTFIVATKLANSVENALTASEAKTIVLTGNANGITNFYVKGYVSGVDGTNHKYIWLDDTASSTQTFEVYNNTNNTFSGFELGEYVVAHGTTSKFETTAEITSATSDSHIFLTLASDALSVNISETVELEVSSKSSGDISWTIQSGDAYAEITASDNDGATIRGKAVGSAVIRATIGGVIYKECTVTVGDWVLTSVELVVDGTFVSKYYKDAAFDKTGITVNAVYHSNLLGEDNRENVTNDATFNFSSASVGSFKLIATYSEMNSTENVYYSVVNKPAYDITFGNSGTKINAASVTSGNWTITTVGTSSYTQSSTYSQVGKSSEPATSITFEKTGVDNTKTYSELFIDLGGFGSTAGTVTLQVGETGSFTTIGTGSLNETADVTVASSSYARGSKIKITITSIAKGVKVYGIGYTLKTDAEMISSFISDNMHMNDYDKDGVHGSTGGDGSCKTYYWTAKAAYNKLLASQKETFCTSEDSAIVAARTRLTDWAVANGETLNLENYVLGSVYSPFLVETKTNNIVLIVISTSLVSVIAISGFFFLRKKKEK